MPRPPARVRSRGSIGYFEFTDQPPATMPPLLVVIGPHLLAADVVDRAIAASVPDESLRPSNTDIVDAQEIKTPDDILARLLALPFLAERRVVVVRGTIDLKKELRDVVTAAFAGASEHAVLVVDHSGKPARPQGRRVSEEARSFSTAAPGGMLVDCDLDQAGFATFAQRCAQAAGVELEPAARTVLSTLADPAEIKNVVDRLALVRERIRVADVNSLAAAPTALKIWDMSDAVMAGDAARALAIKRDTVTKSEEAARALMALAGDMQIAGELAGGANYKAYASALGIHPFRAQKIAWKANSMPPREARRRAALAMEALVRCFNGRREWDQALEEMIVRLSGKAG